MSDPATIFRPEALERHARGRIRAHGFVRLGRPWLSRLFWSALVLFAAGVAALWLTPVAQTATGPALVDGSSGSVTVLLPAAAAADLAGAERLTVEVPGSSAGAVPVVLQGAEVADEATARRAGFGAASQPGIVLTGRLADGAVTPGPSADGRRPARGVLVLRSERLVDVLGHQVQAMLRPGTARR